jgi:hypothetical protein
MIPVSKMNNWLRKNKVSALFGVIFSVTYVIVGYLWFLSPYGKYYPDQPKTIISSIVPILGLATLFLNFSPLIFVPLLVVTGGFIGLISGFLLTFEWPMWIVGLIVWILLACINYGVGLFLYAFAIMIW